jgi:protein TonB
MWTSSIVSGRRGSRAPPSGVRRELPLDYPPVSRRLGEQGTLRLRLAITAEGAVAEAQIESSSGHPRLDDAALQWVKAHWRYEPALEGAKRVPATAKAVVTFKLN